MGGGRGGHTSWRPPRGDGNIKGNFESANYYVGKRYLFFLIYLPSAGGDPCGQPRLLESLWKAAGRSNLAGAGRGQEGGRLEKTMEINQLERWSEV